jgi:hypothetical protein
MQQEYEKQFAQFRENVGKHAVTVLRDDGLYRHLRCSAGSYHMQFDVVTWPGYLAYAGDMGSFVFSRLPDMFEFFRGRQTAMIDRGYLAEKAVASDRHDGLRAYSEEMLRRAVKADFDAFIEAHEPDDADELWEAIEEDVLSCADNHVGAVNAALEFHWPRGRGGRAVFPDFWEHRVEDYTPRFWWCCYAIPWAIEQYDVRYKSALAVNAVPSPSDQPASPQRA